MLNYHNESLPRIIKYVSRGKYNLSFEMCELDKVDYSIRWNDYHLQKTKQKLHEELLFAVHAYTVAQQWTRSRSVSIAEFTLISKYDITQRKRTTYTDPTPASMTRNKWIGGFSRGKITIAQYTH